MNVGDIIICKESLDSCITINKKYIVIDVNELSIEILDDFNKRHIFWYMDNWFYTLQELRSKKIIKIRNESW